MGGERSGDQGAGVGDEAAMARDDEHDVGARGRRSGLTEEGFPGHSPMQPATEEKSWVPATTAG